MTCRPIFLDNNPYAGGIGTAIDISSCVKGVWAMLYLDSLCENFITPDTELVPSGMRILWSGWGLPLFLTMDHPFGLISLGG